MIIKFLLFGFIGWIGEIIFTGLGSAIAGSVTLTGHTYLWMFPIYGMAVFLEPVYNRIRSSPWIIRGIIWAGIIFFMEYLSGWVLKLAIGICPWDYSAFTRYSEDGFIRLDFFPVWFIAGLLYEKINDFLNNIQVTYLSPAGPQKNIIFILRDGRDSISSHWAMIWSNGKERAAQFGKLLSGSKSFFSGSSNTGKQG